MLLLTRLLCLPVDRGANMPGSADAPPILTNCLRKHGVFVDNVDVQVSRAYHETLGNTYLQTLHALDVSNSPVVIAGGDHSISIGTIAAANDHCMSHRESLGVLWCDAHADFNTPQTSPSGNLHGMPVAVLCRHALPSISFGAGLETDQFAYWGVRDVDAREEQRMQDHDMLVLHSNKDVIEWTRRFDRIHVSFDVDCLDPQIAPGVSTPVPGGADAPTTERLFRALRDTGKLLSIDCVELNPTNDEDGRTGNLVTYLIKQLLV